MPAPDSAPEPAPEPAPDCDDVLDAGPFSAWLAATDEALRGERDADVPCGDCTGCCTSSQFVHIAPDETDTLAHVPAELLFPAPRLAKGHVLLGYDEAGHCPMLVGGACSIYEHRPRTCRTYDCRVFPAAGLEVDDPTKAAIAARVRRWQFSHPGPSDAVEHEAVRAAGRHLVDHERDLAADSSAGVVPASTTQLAVAAVGVRRLFLGRDEATGAPVVIEPDVASVRVALGRA